MKKVSFKKQADSLRHIARYDALWVAVELFAPTARALGFLDLWEPMYREKTYKTCDEACKRLYIRLIIFPEYLKEEYPIAEAAMEVACDLRGLTEWRNSDTSEFHRSQQYAFNRIERWIAQQTAPQNMS